MNKTKSVIKILCPGLYISEKLIFFYRISKFLYNINFQIASLFIRTRNLRKYNCSISQRCEIGKNPYMPHPIAIIIGDGAILGNNVHIYHNVTIGAKDEKRICYPTIHDNVIIYANATIIGDISVGEGAIIGAHSLVLDDVEPHSIVCGVPARKIGSC